MNWYKSSLLALETARLDGLVLVDFDSLADRPRLDEHLIVSSHSWPKIPISCHLDGLPA